MVIHSNEMDTNLKEVPIDPFRNQFIAVGYQLNFNAMQDASQEKTEP